MGDSKKDETRSAIQMAEYLREKLGDLPVDLIRGFGGVFDVMLKKIADASPNLKSLESYHALLIELTEDMLYLKDKVETTLAQMEKNRNA